MGSPNSRSRTVGLAWGLGLLLLVLHFDFWRPQRPVLWFGWMPEELMWRIGWMLLAFLYLLWFCGRIWRAEAAER